MRSSFSVPLVCLPFAFSSSFTSTFTEIFQALLATLTLGKSFQCF